MPRPRWFRPMKDYQFCKCYAFMKFIILSAGWLANVLQYLEAQGLVDCRDKLRNGCSPLTQPIYSISKAGLVYLEQRKELAQKNAAEHAKEKAKEAKDDRLRAQDARRSWWQFALGLILGWILGGFTFREFLDWIMGLFG